MKDTPPPPTDDNPGHAILAEMMDVVRVLYGLIEGGIQKARKYMDEECDGKYDPWLFPMIVRNFVCRGADAHAVGDLAFTRRDIPNDGIEITHGRRTIKVWKATPDGELPPAGTSDAKVDFYNRNLFGDDVNLYQSLILLWEFDQSWTLTVQLIAPRSADSSKDASKQLWAVTVPHPATQTVAEPQKHEEDDLHYERADEKRSTQKKSGGSEGDDE